MPNDIAEIIDNRVFHIPGNSLYVYAEESPGDVLWYYTATPAGRCGLSCNEYSPDDTGALTIYQGPANTLRRLAMMRKWEYIESGGLLEIINSPPDYESHAILHTQAPDEKIISRLLTEYEFSIFKNEIEKLETYSEKVFFKVYKSSLGKRIMGFLER